MVGLFMMLTIMVNLQLIGFRKDNMKLTEQRQKQIMKNNPNQPFDICSKCGGVQLYGTMKDINEIDFDLICNDCINQQASKQKG